MQERTERPASRRPITTCYSAIIVLLHGGALDPPEPLAAHQPHRCTMHGARPPAAACFDGGVRKRARRPRRCKCLHVEPRRLGQLYNGPQFQLDSRDSMHLPVSAAALREALPLPAQPGHQTSLASPQRAVSASTNP